MSVASWLRSLFTTQDPATYKSAIDGNFAVLERVGAMFACQQAATPNMTVVVRAGSVMDAGSLVEIAQQTTAAITAPASASRIDRIVIDQRTGVYTVVPGTPGVSPVPPAIPAGKLPCAQILLQSTSTAITNSMITDERVFGSASDAYMDVQIALLATIASPTFTGIPRAPTAAQGNNSTQLATTAYCDAAAIAASFPSGTRMPFNQSAAPTGWTKDATAALNDSVMRIVTGTAASGGSVGLGGAAYTPTISTTIGTLTSAAYALQIADMPIHSHIMMVDGIACWQMGTGGVGRHITNTTQAQQATQELTGQAGGTNAHSHALSGSPASTSSTITLGLKYNDFIIATKN